MLTGILGITILSQVIFALIAYWVIVDVERDHSYTLLNRHTNEVAQNIVIPLATGTPESKVLSQSVRHFTPTVDLLALLKPGEVIATAGPLASLMENNPELGAILRSDNPNNFDNGQVDIDGQTFLLVTRDVPGLPYRIVALQKQALTQNNLIGKLGSRFFVFSIAIVWMAIWIALLLAATINRKLEEKRTALRHQVTHDTLTGLPNRAQLLEKLDEVIASPDEIDMQLSVLAIGINRFREINETLGHDLGDQLLLEMGGRIRQMLPEEALVFRLEGDEFSVLLMDSDQHTAEQHIHQLLISMDTRVPVSLIELDIGLAIGAALYPKHATDACTLLRYARVALQQARDRCTGFLFYDSYNDNHSIRRLRLSAELSHAIENGDLTVFYQPKIHARSGTVDGLEALARWNHPEYGLIPPDEFIPLAEQTGAIRELTSRILDESLHFIHHLNSTGKQLSVAVNISTYSLRDEQLASRVGELLEQTGISGQHLCLEVTETIMMQDIQHAHNVLRTLHDLGVKISIDDFGTGFSSLAYLNRLPVDEIKIDRSFVMRMLDNHNEHSIVHSIINLAHTLGYQVVAEGVENRETLYQLQSMECDLVQGYLLTAPRPPSEIERWLEGYQPASVLRTAS